MPALGASYYRLRITDIDSLDPTVVPEAGRQEGRVGVPSQSLKLGQLGVTVVHSVFPRLHAGATFKYRARNRGRHRNRVDGASLRRRRRPSGRRGTRPPGPRCTKPRRTCAPHLRRRLPGRPPGSAGPPRRGLRRRPAPGRTYQTLHRVARRRPARLRHRSRTAPRARGRRGALACRAAASGFAAAPASTRSVRASAPPASAPASRSSRTSWPRSMPRPAHAPSADGVWPHALPSDAARRATADRTRSRRDRRERRRRELRGHRGRPPRRSASQREAHHP